MLRVDYIEFNAQVPAAHSPRQKTVRRTSLASQGSQQRGTQDVRLPGDGLHRSNSLSESAGERLIERVESLRALAAVSNSNSNRNGRSEGITSQLAVATSATTPGTAVLF